MDPHDSPHKERLWTPWRMRYIGGDTREESCIFCNRLAADDDVSSLILHRAAHCFVIMNLYPYNTGHVMVVPNRHESDLDHLDEDTLTEMATVLPRILKSLRTVLGCDGFNIGLNLGSVAGAGVADHLHQHVVPRWEGDANFMPILAGTMVIPEMIPVTYAKTRAELIRVMDGADRFDTVVLSSDAEPVVWLKDGRIPSVEAEPGVPVWRAAIASLETPGAEIVGWSGAKKANDATAPPGLVFRVDGRPSGSGWHAVPLRLGGPGAAGLSETDLATVNRTARNIAPWISAPTD